MKNRTFFLATLAVLLFGGLQSCEKVYQYGILTFSNPTIKDSGISVDLKEKGLSIYASRDNAEFFNNTHYKFQYKWYYENEQHWNKGDFRFAMLYPYGHYDWNAATGIVKMDFTYSYPCDGLCLTGYNERSYDGSNNAPVEVQLQHANCRLSVNICNKTDYGYITLQGGEIYELLFKGSIELGPEGRTIAVSDIPARQKDKLYKSDIPSTNILKGKSVQLFPRPVTVAPQDVRYAALSITYSENGTPRTVAFNLNKLSDVTRWDTGKTYTYNVDIYNATAVITVSVQDWIDETIDL